MPKLLENKWYIDEIYNKYLIDPITNFSRNGLWRGFDLGSYKDYRLVEFRGGIFVFSGVNIVEPGGLEITPVVKK